MFYNQMKKILGLERRRFPRYPTAMEVEFYIWNAVERKPRTGKAQGFLANISGKGAHLQTNNIRIEDSHIMLDSDSTQNILILDFAPSTETPSWSIKAQVLSYKRVATKCNFQFDVRLQFIEVSADQRQHLEAMIKSNSFHSNPSPIL
jgi:hypothetical protein